MGAADRIKELQDELRKTSYNKATEHHFGVVKAKIARLREKLETQAKKKGGGHGWHVKKSGDASVVIVGFPSVGKSTLLNNLTGAKSNVGMYAFTTLDVVPGVLKYNHAEIQMLDVPGILRGAAAGKGRGKEVLAMVRASDMVLILVDALQPKAYPVILNELHDFGVRVNQTPPDVKIMKRSRGGIVISHTVKLTKLSNRLIESVMREFRINNAEILFRENVNVDQLIDVIKKNRKYVKALTVVNKVDLISDAKKRTILKKIKPDLMISAHDKTNIAQLKHLIFTKLNFIRIYLKERNKEPDLKEPMIVPRGATIRIICDKIHRDFVKKYKYAKVWGSSKFGGQIIRRLDRELKDGDIVEIYLD